MRILSYVLVAAVSMLHAATAQAADQALPVQYFEGRWHAQRLPGEASNAVALSLQPHADGLVDARFSFLGVSCALREASAQGRYQGQTLTLKFEPQGDCPESTLTFQIDGSGTATGVLTFSGVIDLVRPVNLTLQSTSVPTPSLPQQWQEDTARTWTAAEVFLPGKFFPTTVDDVHLDKPAPVVVYIHGCAGLDTSLRYLAKWLNERGYVVVAPNSFARHERPLNCDSKDKVYGKNLEVLSYREAEIEYAARQLEQLSWADPHRLFLIGHSEGGDAASRTRAKEFRGIVISGSSCFNGIQAPDDVAALAVYSDNDTWNKRSQRCPEATSKRLNASSVALHGSEHWTLDAPPVVNALAEFLQRNSQAN